MPTIEISPTTSGYYSSQLACSCLSSAETASFAIKIQESRFPVCVRSLDINNASSIKVQHLVKPGNTNERLWLNDCACVDV
jgi:hypothetical protein